MRARDLVLVFIVLIAIAMIPWVDGYIVKTHYLELISNLNNLNHQSKIKVIDYSQGWLGSSVTLHIEPVNAINRPTSNSKNTIPAFATTIEQTISHGPYLYDDANKSWTFALAEIQSDVAFPSLFSSFFIKQSDKSDVHADTIVSFFGNSISHVVMPVFLIKPQFWSGKITWNGLSGDININVANKTIDEIIGNVSLGAISITNDLGNVTTSEIKLKYNLDYQKVGLWNGKYYIEIPNILVSDQNGPRLTLKNLNFNSSFGVDNYNLYNADAKASVANGMMSDLSITSGLIKLSLENLNSKKLLEIFQLPPGEMNQTIQILPGIINYTTTAEEDITINTSSGKLSSSGKVFWPKEIKLPQSMDEINAHYNMRLDVRASISLVNKFIEVVYGNSSSSLIDQAPSSPTVTQPSVQNMLNQVDIWKNQNLIALDVSYQLKDLIQRKLTEEVFAKNIDQYVLRKDLTMQLATWLKTEYTAIFPNPNNKNAPLPVVAQPVVMQPQLTPADLIHKKIQEWIKQGLIKQDKDDYVVLLIRK